MKCPFCETEMLSGFLNTGMTIWSERKHKISLLPQEDELYSLRLGRPIWNPHYVASDYCPGCGKIIIDSTPYESGRGRG